MSEHSSHANEAERRYTEAARLMVGLSAIGHLVTKSSPRVRRAFDELEDAASEHHGLAREHNLAENDWVYNIDPSPLIHPDHTDPSQRRPVVVAILDGEEADLAVETAGPFPMVVAGEDGTRHTIHTEDELRHRLEKMHGAPVTTIRPLPFAASLDD